MAFLLKDIPNKRKKCHKLTIVFCVLFILLTFFGNSNGGKGKKMAKTKREKKSEGWEEILGHETIATNRKCPEKGETTSEEDESENEKDQDNKELIQQFKKFLEAKMRGTPSANFEEAFRQNSLIWYFTQKIFDLLSVDIGQFNGANSVDELNAKMAQFHAKWAQIRNYQRSDDRIMVVCILYKYGSELIRETVDFGQQIAEWGNLLVKNRLLEVITNKEVHCDEPSNAREVYSKLMSKASVDIIIGQNLAHLLEVSQNLRHFFCHETEMTQMKFELNAHIDADEMRILENQFPEIMRIDIPLTPTLHVRFKIILLYRSCSELHKEALMSWTMGQLINSLNTRFVELCMNPGILLYALGARLRSVVTYAYRNLLSEKHLCALIKMHQFMESTTPEMAHKNNEKMVKRWHGLEECAEENERRQTIAQFEKSDQRADWVVQALDKVRTLDEQGVREFLVAPGAKTRLVRLLGSRERFEQITGDRGLFAGVYRQQEEVFLDDVRCWAHYKMVLEEQHQNDDRLWIKSVKLGTDLFVFVRWMKQKFAASNQNEIWDKMHNFVLDELYDPLFDRGEEEVNRWENILFQIFARTKKLMKQFLNKKMKNVFKKWKETAIDEAMKSEEKVENEQEIVEWMEGLHRTEFEALLANGFLDEFREIFITQNAMVIYENMRTFFTEKTIDNLCEKAKNGVQFGEESSKMGQWEAQKGENGTKEEGAVTETAEVEQRHKQGEREQEKQLKEMLWTSSRGTNERLGEGTSQTEGQNHIACPTTEQVHEVLEHGPIEIIGESLQKAYIHFLTNSTQQAVIYELEGGKKVLAVELLGIAWRLMVVCEELATIAVELALALTAPRPPLSVEAQAMVCQWNELLQMLDEFTSPEQKIFFLYKFLRFWCNNETMKGSEKWTEQLQNEPFLCIIVRESAVGINVPNEEQWTVPKYDNMEAVQIYELLMAPEKKEMINMILISSMLERFKKIQWLICHMNNKQLETCKTKLSKLIGVDNLLELDAMYPEVMKISVPIPLVQSALYKAFLRLPSFSDQSVQACTRLVLPMLLHHVRLLCDTIRNPLDRTISNAFHTKFSQLEIDAFLHLRDEPEKPLLNIVCVLQKFLQYMLTSVQLYQSNRGAIRESAILRWTDRKCQSDMEEQRIAYQQQFDVLSIYHFEYLKRIIEENVDHFQQFMHNNRGVRTRAAKLLTEKHKHLLRTNHFRLSDCKTFSDFHLLTNYLGTIFDDTTMGRVVCTLSVQFSVFVRWMDAQLTEHQNQRPIGLRKVYDEVWTKVRPDFEDIYDGIVDKDLNELEQFGYFLRELIPRAKEFVAKKGTERSLKKQQNKMGQKAEGRHHPLKAEWDKMVEEAHRKAREMRPLEEDEEEEELWAKRTHMDTLIKLVSTKQNGRENVSGAFAHNAEARERLANWVPLERIDDFLDILRAKDQNEFERKVGILKEKMDSEVQEKTKEGIEGNEAAENEAELADQNMHILIREEERMKELKEEMAERQEEKRKRRRESEQKRKEDRERRRELRDSGETPAVGVGTALMPPFPHGGTPAMGGRCSEEDELMDDSPPSRYGDSPIPSPSRYFWNGESPSKHFASPSRRSAIKSPTSQAKWQRRELGTEMQKELANLQRFSSDDFLHFAYAQFLANPSESKGRILDIGIFVNEISHRAEIVGKLKQILENKKGTEPLGKAFEEKRLKEIATFVEEFKPFLTVHISETKTEGDFEDIAGILHKVLKRSIFELEGQSWEEEQGEEGDGEEMNMVRKQLHRNKLAKALTTADDGGGGGEEGTAEGTDGGEKEKPKRAKSIWDSLEEKEQSKMLAKIIGTMKPNLADRFKEHLEGWRTLAEQQRIDKELFEQFEGNNLIDKNNTILGVNFPEKTQQIYFKCSEDTKQEQFLMALLHENGFNNARSTHFASALNALKAIVSEWSKGNARLLETGSYLLRAHAIDADIDTICVVRQRFATQAEQMGTFFGKNYCNLEERICEDNTLYCALCKHPNVGFLNKTPRAYMPMIQMIFFGIKFDMSLVSIPEIESLPDEPMDATDVKWLMEILALSPKPHGAMLKSLSGCLANYRILELMRNKNNTEKFRRMLRSIKFWAKTNYIYGSLFGFLNGASLSVLAAKVILWYPNCSVPFLFEKLMFILMNWRWPVPIKLIEQRANNEFESFTWNPFDASTALIMPILTACSSLAQNAAQNINKSTFAIIQNTIVETFVRLRELRNSPTETPATDEKNNWWNELFPVKQFTDKYAHFVIINCLVSFPQHINQFCRYVERKLRFQLENFEEILHHLIEFSHVSPNFKVGTASQCAKRGALQSSHNHFSICKRWLIGLKIKQQNGANCDALDAEKRQLVNETFDREVAVKIHREYIQNVLRGTIYQHVGIESRYIAAEELASEWDFEQ